MMELIEWVKIPTLYDSEKQALKIANIVATTEARLANQQNGPQYEVDDPYRASRRKMAIILAQSIYWK